MTKCDIEVTALVSKLRTREINQMGMLTAMHDFLALVTPRLFDIVSQIICTLENDSVNDDHTQKLCDVFQVILTKTIGGVCIINHHDAEKIYIMVNVCRMPISKDVAYIPIPPIEEQYTLSDKISTMIEWINLVWHLTDDQRLHKEATRVLVTVADILHPWECDGVQIKRELAASVENGEQPYRALFTLGALSVDPLCIDYTLGINRNAAYRMSIKGNTYESFVKELESR